MKCNCQQSSLTNIHEIVNPQTTTHKHIQCTFMSNQYGIKAIIYIFRIEELLIVSDEILHSSLLRVDMFIPICLLSISTQLLPLKNIHFIATIENHSNKIIIIS